MLRSITRRRRRVSRATPQTTDGDEEEEKIERKRGKQRAGARGRRRRRRRQGQWEEGREKRKRREGTLLITAELGTRGSGWRRAIMREKVRANSKFVFNSMATPLLVTTYVYSAFPSPQFPPLFCSRTIETTAGRQQRFLPMESAKAAGGKWPCCRANETH